MTTCKTSVALILLLLGVCDAFVQHSKPSLLTRILSFYGDNSADPYGWDEDSPYQQNQGHQEYSYPPVEREWRDREQQIELQIQELKATLGRMKAKQENTQNTHVLVTLLDVSDNLARALEAVPAEEKETNEALKALCQGVEMTEKGLDQVFEMSGIVKYGAVGEQFDHNIHHALCEYPDPEMEPDTIGHIIKAGYLLNGSVLRYAEVAVVKSQPSPTKSCEVTY